MIVWVAAWMRVVLKVVSLAAVLSHQVTLLSNIGEERCVTRQNGCEGDYP